jgi:hypothetical protein
MAQFAEAEGCELSPSMSRWAKAFAMWLENGPEVVGPVSVFHHDHITQAHEARPKQEDQMPCYRYQRKHPPRAAVPDGLSTRVQTRQVCRLPLEVGEELLEVLDTVGGKGNGGQFTDIPDGKDTVFRLHVHGDVAQQVLVFAKHLGHPGDGGGGTGRRHRSGRAIEAGSSRPMPGEQFLQPRGGVITDAREHVGEPGARIDVVQLCRYNQRIHRRRPLPATVRTCEQP